MARDPRFGAARDTLTVGLLQFAPQERDARGNVRFIHSHIRHLEEAIVVLPEFFLGSYVNHPLFFPRDEDLRRLLVPLLELSEERRVSLVGSLPIEDGGRSYNRALLIHEGRLRSVYDKSTLFGDEHGRFASGDASSSSFDLEGIRCSVRTCMDIVDPLPEDERGAVRLILGPAAVSVDFLRKFHEVRAWENGAMSVFCNRSGSEPARAAEYMGRSAIFFPDGTAPLELDRDAEKLATVSVRRADLAAQPT